MLLAYNKIQDSTPALPDPPDPAPCLPFGQVNLALEGQPTPSVGPSKSPSRSGSNDIGIRKSHAVYGDGGAIPVPIAILIWSKSSPNQAFQAKLASAPQPKRWATSTVGRSPG